MRAQGQLFSDIWLHTHTNTVKESWVEKDGKEAYDREKKLCEFEKGGFVAMGQYFFLISNTSSSQIAIVYW